MLSYSCKNSGIYEDCTLSNSLIALYFGIRALLCCFDCCCRSLVSKYIISIRLTLTFFLYSLLFYLLLVFIAKHVIIKGKLCLYLLLVIIYFSHVTHIDKTVYLLFLIFWPNISGFWLCFLILFRERRLSRLWGWLSSFRILRYFFRFFFLLVSCISLLLNSFCSYIVLQKLFFMSFKDLWLLWELISQSFNNLLNHRSFDNFTLKIFINIFIRIPIRLRRTDHGCSFFLRIVQALNIFLGIDDDIFIEGVICIFFWGIASFGEKLRVIID